MDGHRSGVRLVVTDVLPGVEQGKNGCKSNWIDRDFSHEKGCTKTRIDCSDVSYSLMGSRVPQTRKTNVC